MNADEIPQGQLFSRVYLRPTELASDSPRMRRRVSALITATLDAGADQTRLAELIAQKAGVDVTMGIYGYLWREWIAHCDLRDLLDALTLAVAFQRKRGRRWEPFVSAVNTIFDEEAVHYQMDHRGGVHYRVDEEFERQLTFTVAGLGAARFAAVREELDRSLAALQSAEPDGKTAIQAMFEAAETLFRLAYPARARLTRSNVLQDMRPSLAQRYAGNQAAVSSAQEAAESFGEWVDACHVYRHGQGNEEPNQPPLAHAILLVSQGLSFLRWLAGFVPDAE